RPRPPSPPFPYTTLFRSPREVIATAGRIGTDGGSFPQRSHNRGASTGRFKRCTRFPVSGSTIKTGKPAPVRPSGGSKTPHFSKRSEEHTSELQSRENLVC